MDEYMLQWLGSPILTLGFCLLIARLMYRGVYNAHFNPLVNFPGPKHRGISACVHIVDLWRGRSLYATKRLHDMYGPVVRIAPDMLSFTDPEAWKDIYGLRKGGRQLAKDYKRFPDTNEVTSILASSDADHARIRKVMAHAFTDSAIQEQKPLISSHIDSLAQQLLKRSNGGTSTVVELNNWYNLLSFDIVRDLSFGKSFGGLHTGQLDQSVTEFLEFCKSYPIVPMSWEYLPVKILLKLMMNMPSVKRQQEASYLATQASVESRMKEDPGERKDFMTYILGAPGEDKMSKSEITASTGVLIFAGGETVATCLAATTYLILSNPHVHDKVKEEIRKTFATPENIIEKANTLPYLNAVIEESLRVYPPAPGNFARTTGAQPENIAGYVVPPNTSVGVHQYATNHCPTNFHDPDTFDPDRWLPDAPEKYHHDRKAAAQPFSYGRRACIGKRLAYFEVAATLATMLWYFDMELDESSKDWIAKQTFNIIWNRIPLHVKLAERRPHP